MRIFLNVLIGLFIFAGQQVQADENVAKAVVSAAFEEFEKQMIHKYFDEHTYYHDDHGYYHDHPGNKKKNKQKRIPPGIAMKLERGGTMPPGIAKQVLPYDLERQLPPVKEGYERTIVGSDVLLVEVDTGHIADIITDVILGD